MKTFITPVKIGIALCAIFLFSINLSHSQTYSAWGVGSTGDTLDSSLVDFDTMYFDFTGLPAGMWGDAKIVVYFEGDFGLTTETSDNFISANSTGPNLLNIGISGPSSSGTDCSPMDSTVFYVNTSSISTIGTSLTVKSIPNTAVDANVCFAPRGISKVRFEVNYCAFGVPTQFAQMNLTSNEVCPYENALLSGIPLGGTFSGTGVNGALFDPSNLSPGTYTITYEATDNIGCMTQTDTQITVLPTPVIDNIINCFGDSQFVETNSSNTFIYYSDQSLTLPIDTGSNLNGPPIYADQTIYAKLVDINYDFMIDTVYDTTAITVDHNPITGDDRGGMAVTQNYVYVVGDNNTGRYDLDLTPSSAVALPKRDGLFSDLATGTLYTLYNSITGEDPVSNPGTFDVNSFMVMNEDLALTGSLIQLNQTITVGTNSIIAPSAGFVLIYNDLDDHVYKVSVYSGFVTDLGLIITIPGQQGTENWIDWGLSGYDGVDYYLYYRKSSLDQITQQNLSTGAETEITNWTDVGDMASFTYAPWNNKFYLHYEGSGGQWGGGTETTVRLGGEHSLNFISQSPIGCYAAVDITVPSIDLGPNLTFCEGSSEDVSVGLGFSNIVWNGDTTNVNSFTANSTGEIAFSGFDIATGCWVHDTINSTTIDLPLVDLTLIDDDACDDETSITLDGGLPINGVYSGNFVSGSTFDVSAAGVGIHVVNYTYTDANGCSNTASAGIIVEVCTGIDEIGEYTMTVFPNPATDIITIKTNKSIDKEMNIALFDIQGKEVYRKQVLFNDQESIDVSSFESGIYLLRTDVDEESKLLKIVVQ